MPELTVELIQKACLHVRGNGLWCDRALNMEGVPLVLAARWLAKGRELLAEGHLDPEEDLAIRLVLAMDYAESVCLANWVRRQEACKNGRDEGQWQRFAALIQLRFPDYSTAGPRFGRKDRALSLEAELKQMDAGATANA